MKRIKAKAKWSRTTWNLCGTKSSMPIAWGNLLLKDNMPMLIRRSVSLPIRHPANSTDKHLLSFRSSRNASSTWEAALLCFWATFQYSYYSSVSSAVLEILINPPAVVLSTSQPAALHCQPSKPCQISCPFKKKYVILQSTGCWKTMRWSPTG